MRLSKNRAWVILAVAIAGIAYFQHTRSYSSLREKWQRRGLADHFPQTIPEGATVLGISEFPKFLQGGGWLQVRLGVSASELETQFEEASRRAKAFYDGGDSLTLVNAEQGGLPGADFHTSGGDERSFPQDYRVFVYHAQPYEPGKAHQWNHGTCQGVAISRARNEIVYFSEVW